MAKKKSKRPNLPQETLERARAELRGERTEVAAPVEAVRPTSTGTAAPRPKAGKRTGVNLATRRIPSLEELRAEYSYVTSDLRNLAILALILIAGIIAAAVVLPHPTG